ncbi:Phosphotransferase enzyme family protein [Parafrankia irregularis]|uniref:Phosphotransferase enzyme family protein n=1 Tax=Parafrankia irregularis TaxID=795642 RepID=A0A0S4QHZ7_9ACTN|nr:MULTISPECIES: aminoglycoside phosphotransferase family protein [Parafrankia]MBE3204032.1 aminoglycoside phosphotransferase family protein [Parafrankia sp. CH37]CUU55091.1 Phosphotransferase enzyme family protein [Parafrankia irregularis]
MSAESASVVALPDELHEVLSPGWLNKALAIRYPGIEIVEVTPGPVVSRVSTNARFRIDCTGGVPKGLSPHLCAKGYFSEIGRSASPAGVPETSFYRDLADRTGVRTLRSVFADVDARTDANIVITEDVVAEGGVFLDGLSDYTPDQAADSLDQLATLHAATWADPSLADVGWLRSRLDGYLRSRGLPEISANFACWIGAGVPDETRDAERLVAAYRRLAAETAAASPWAVIHGDPHIGNVFLDGAGRPSFLDWQLVQRGPWYIDVGYHIASALTVADRRRSERDLLAHYLDRLRAGGVRAPEWDEAWRAIGRGILHGFYLWGITVKVDPPITAALLERLGTAAADHDVFAAVGA